MSKISEYLNQIKTAIYGREVRDAIHDSIEQCYSDVTNAKTLADAATTAANDATAKANTATSNANSAATKATDAAAKATSAASSANTAASKANDATTKANAATDKANTAASNADTATSKASEATTKANAATEKANTAASNADTATTKANEATTKVNTATEKANTAASNADSKATAANDAANKANVAASNADTKANAANDAAEKINGLSVSVSGLSPDDLPTADLTENDGHYNLALGIPKGKSGVYRGKTQPTDPDVNIWLCPSGNPTNANVLIGDRNGNPVFVSDAYETLLYGLHIYGRSIQYGTPSADNPIAIVGAGAEGILKIIISGSNLLDFEKCRKDSSRVDFGYEDGVLTVQALSTQGYAGISIPLPLECAGKRIYFTRTINSNPSNLKSLIQLKYVVNGKTSYYSGSSTITIPENVTSVEYNIMVRNENTATEGTITVNYPVVCYGSELLPYESYREQSIAVKTSGGLHGLPVSSGGNYVDTNGREWLCDEINFAQGKLIKRVNPESLDATKTLGEQTNFEIEPVECLLSSDEIAAYQALIAYAPTTVVQAKNVSGIELKYQRDINVVIKNLEKTIASVATN